MKRVRKLYLKSKLNFGRFEGMTVQEVLNMGSIGQDEELNKMGHEISGYDYILWAVNRFKWLSLSEEVIKEIGNCQELNYKQTGN